MIDISLNEQTVLIAMLVALLVVVVLWIISLNKSKQLSNEITELKQKLFGIISHDLKNPLININYGLEYLKKLDKKNIDEERYNNYLDIMMMVNLANLQENLFMMYSSEEDISRLC